MKKILMAILMISSIHAKALDIFVDPSKVVCSKAGHVTGISGGRNIIFTVDYNNVEVSSVLLTEDQANVAKIVCDETLNKCQQHYGSKVQVIPAADWVATAGVICN